MCLPLRQLAFLVTPAMLCISAVFDIESHLSVRLSVRHNPVLYQNGLTYRRNSFIINHAHTEALLGLLGTVHRPG